MLLDCPRILGVQNIFYSLSHGTLYSIQESQSRMSEIMNYITTKFQVIGSQSLQPWPWGHSEMRWKGEFMSREWKRDQKWRNCKSKMRQVTFKMFLVGPFKMINTINENLYWLQHLTIFNVGVSHKVIYWANVIYWALLIDSNYSTIVTTVVTIK